MSEDLFSKSPVTNARRVVMAWATKEPYGPLFGRMVKEYGIGETHELLKLCLFELWCNQQWGDEVFKTVPEIEILGMEQNRQGGDE